MQRHLHTNGVVTYSFDSLTAQPVHAHVSTRHGGVSPTPWQSLNFSVLRGDASERVAENYVRLSAALGVERGHLITCKQVHGTGIGRVDWVDAGTRMDGCDGLITDAIGLPLMLVFADCVPILLYDPQHHALGVCHAGWRGTLNGAATAMLWAMQAAFDSRPVDVIACIGPSIGPTSYEVGAEVLALAQARLANADELFTWPNGADQRPYFDLWRANATQLVDAGVPLQKIEISGIDTAQSTDDFFSHRAEQGRCGLFSLVAWLAQPAAS